MESTLRPLWLALLVAIFVQLTRSQVGKTPLRIDVGSCPPVVLSNFGNTTHFSQLGILPVTFVAADGSPPETVRVKEFHLLCESIGSTKNSASSISALVRYDTLVKTNIVDQVTVDCVPPDVGQVGARFYTPTPPGTNALGLDTTRVSQGSKLRENQAADFSTLTNLNCGRCVDESAGEAVRPDIHCLPCRDECNVGMKRCTSRLLGHCCNWFNNDTCVASCPEPLKGNPDTFDCGCGSLNTSLNGIVKYGNQFVVESVATFTCEEGFVLNGAGSAICTTNGWNVTVPTCVLFDCGPIPVPEKGFIQIVATIFGTVVTVQCEEGYVLQGDATRKCEISGWSGSNPICEEKVVIQCENCNGGSCDFDTGSCKCPATMVKGSSCGAAGPSGRSAGCGTPCIIGIVVAFIATIILVATVLGVAFGIYNYMNHPDTKMAKYDADNINGVARDNPLYVDPEAVVGDGAEAA